MVHLSWPSAVDNCNPSRGAGRARRYAITLVASKIRHCGKRRVYASVMFYERGLLAVGGRTSSLPRAFASTPVSLAQRQCGPASSESNSRERSSVQATHIHLHRCCRGGTTLRGIATATGCAGVSPQESRV